MVSISSKSCWPDRGPDRAVLKSLRARISRIESRFAEPSESSGVMTLGAPEIDEALPWGGLPRAALHEVLAGHQSAASGFCAGLLARLAGTRETVLWCGRGRGGLYGPGLAAFGLAPERLILVRARTDTEVLWVLEEGLRSCALAAVLGETNAIGLTAARRLQLAAESGGTSAFLLRSARGKVEPGPAATRWHIATALGTDGDNEMKPRWQVELLKCRSGVPGVALTQKGETTFGLPRSWLVEWRDGTRTPAAGGFAVAATSGLRPGYPAEPGLAV